MPEIVRCPACGKETYRDIPQCPHCGESFHGVSWPTAPSLTTAEPTPRSRTYEFRTGIVFSDGFSVFFKNILPFGALGIMFLSLTFLFEWLVGDSPVDMTIFLQLSAARVHFGIDDSIFNLALLLLLTATITSGTFQALRGSRVYIGECLSSGLSRLFHVFGVSIIFIFAVGLAMTVAIGPALLLSLGQSTGQSLLIFAVALILASIVSVRYCVAVPAAVVERHGVFKSLERSVQLTQGCRLRLFSIGVGCVAIVIFFQTVIGLAMNIVAHQMARTSTNIDFIFTVDQAASFIVTVLVQAFISVMTCVTYFELRRCKEGLGVNELAEVFA